METVMKFMMENSNGMKMIWSLIIIGVVFTISKFVKNILYKKIEDKSRYHKYKRFTNYISGVFLLMAILFVWIDSEGNITTYMGLLSAGIAIALKELFVNIAGWIFIELRRPFDVGHRILIGDQKGDVIDKRLFQFSLMEVSSYEDGEQSTGRIVDVPNSFVFIHPIVNYTKGFEHIWNEIKVLLTFESDWKDAKERLLEIVSRDNKATNEKVSQQMRTATKNYMIQYNKLTPIVYTDVKESGVQLTIRYLCEPKQRRVTANRIWEEILTMIEEVDNIHLAYPTKRVVN